MEKACGDSRSHALRGNAFGDASRPGQRTEQVTKRPCRIPTQSVGTRMCVKFPSTDTALSVEEIPMVYA